MIYQWKSDWYKVTVKEQDGIVQGKAEWDQNGRVLIYEVPPMKMYKSPKDWDSINARSVWSSINYEMLIKRSAFYGRETGPMKAYKNCTIIEDSGQGLLL